MASHVELNDNLMAVQLSKEGCNFPIPSIFSLTYLDLYPLKKILKFGGVEGVPHSSLCAPLTLDRPQQLENLVVAHTLENSVQPCPRGLATQQQQQQYAKYAPNTKFL
ncbi:hypothetical protein TNCV_2885091 [Trichonephila clavipes]|nr:hypothetical protein TNCV_2885091 [Trichonephila clavipes]